MPSNQARRDAERQRLQRQLQERRTREAAHKRRTVLFAVVGTVVVVAGVAVAVAVAESGGSAKPKPKAGGSSQATTSPTATSPTPSVAPTIEATTPDPSVPCAAPKGNTVSFNGLTVTGATNIQKSPTVTGKGTVTPTSVTCQDLVVGKGAAAKLGDQVTVEYIGLLYKTGKVFQTSWTSQPATFAAQTNTTGQTSGVIAGFAEGIAGKGKIAAMHVGGRRLILMPSAAAYGSAAQQGIPANSVLAFVVDLQKAA